MKRSHLYLSLMIMLILLLGAVSAWAKGTANIRNTIHNMSTTQPFPINPYESKDETEVCIFCHTPHGGSLSGPLWNRSLPTGPWTHYNSATLSTYLKGLSATRAVNDESLLCMSCHDGSISVYHLLNPSNTLGHNPYNWFTSDDDFDIVVQGGGNPGARIGGLQGDISSGEGLTGRLDDDHPISFSYTSVLASPEYSDINSPKYGQLRKFSDPVGQTPLDWQGEGVKFFGDVTESRVECSTCHDPHVDYETDDRYKPFLRRPNDGSNLCLACHNK